MVEGRWLQHPGFCGVGAIFESMKYLSTNETRHIYLAALLVPVALVFDVLDGRIARWRHEASPMGRELDSLADVISFGVAPAAIAFAAGVNSRLDQAMLLFFTGCGVSRLARYNVTAESLSTETGKVTYFEGTPIPTTIVPLGALMLALPATALALAGWRPRNSERPAPGCCRSSLDTALGSASAAPWML
jgi:CDP-diacylglycerol--serine O-phosphatidyltransferase